MSMKMMLAAVVVFLSGCASTLTVVEGETFWTDSNYCSVVADDFSGITVEYAGENCVVIVEDKEKN